MANLAGIRRLEVHEKTRNTFAVLPGQPPISALIPQLLVIFLLSIIRLHSVESLRLAKLCLPDLNTMRRY